MARVDHSQRQPKSADWGAQKVRRVSRLDEPVNWERRGRSTRQSHAHHHDKTKRMEH